MMNESTFQGNGKVTYVPVIVNGKQAKQTNADRIRAMTDEELADWLTVLCWYPVEKYGIEPVKDWWIDWLKRDSEEWKKV